MIGKLLGAFAGQRIARESGGNGTMGAVLGAGAAAAVRRMGPVAAVAALLGVFALKRHSRKTEDKPPVAPAKRKVKRATA